MTAPVSLTIKEQIDQLEQARKIVLENATYYPKIVEGILPIIGPTSPVELRRWGAEFLAESLASPAVSNSDREALSLLALERLRELLDCQNEDVLVVKSGVIAAASAYPMILGWTIRSPDTLERAKAWHSMSAMKTRILRMWEDAVSPVKICCVKFAQRVVLAQKDSNGLDRNKNGLDINLSMIPATHPLLEPRQLEAEATGLLDRMLSVLQDNSSDALLVDGTLNSLAVLVRTRPGTVNKVLNTVLNFNPLKLANSPMTAKTKVLIKSMEKTTRTLLFHLAKRDPNNPMSGRLQQHAERLARQRAEILDEGNRKRGLPLHGADGYGPAKRAKLERGPGAAPHFQTRPLGPGPYSVASIFALANTRELLTVDIKQIPAPLVARITAATLANISPGLLGQALNAVRDRFHTLHTTAQAPAALPIDPEKAPLDVEDDDDDYEPDFFEAEDTRPEPGKLALGSAETAAAPEDTTSALATLGTFKLPPPPLLDAETAIKVGQVAVSRVFAPLPALDEGAVRKTKIGLNRLAASSYDRDSWTTLITRLATRSTAGLEDGSGSLVKCQESDGASLSDSIREMLFCHVLEDFRRRIDVAVAWLCEEWYNDRLTRRRGVVGAPLHYEKWALRVVDGFLDYLTPQDKILTRFLAEIPELSRELMGRMKTLCGDPTRVQLALTSLLYLVIMKPPTRELALDTVAEIWQDIESARPLAAKYLLKWRPGFLEGHKDGATMMAAAPAAATT